MSVSAIIRTTSVENSETHTVVMRRRANRLNACPKQVNAFAFHSIFLVEFSHLGDN